MWSEQTKRGVVLVAVAGLLPVWRSGGRENLTFYGWVWNHWIFGPKVEYVPEEDYQAEVCRLGRRY